MSKNVGIVLLMIVLIVGTTGVGTVYAETSDSDMDVTVKQDDPVPSIDGYTSELSYNGDQEIDFSITTDSEDDAVDKVELDVDYIGDGDDGEATVSDSSGDIYKTDNDDWDGDGTYEGSHTFSDNFWRYGNDDDDWEITLTVTDSNSDTYTDTETYSVDEHVSIDSVDDASASGQPGDTLSGADFDDDNGNQPSIEITANCDWSLSLDNAYTLEDSDGNTIDGDDTSGTYSSTSGSPDDGVSYDIDYTVTIPIGQEADEYSTTNSDSPVSHSLSNSE